MSTDKKNDREDLVEWFADEIVENQNGVHTIRAFTEARGTGEDKRIDSLVELTFVNSVGSTCDVDDKLERINMMEWRQVCDKTLVLLLEKCGFNPDKFNWPTPKPRVTHVADEDDVTETVTVTFPVDRLTFLTVKRCLERIEAVCKDYEGVEWCPCCETEFSYKMDASKLVAVCPKCGALVALCNECDRRKDCAPMTCEALKIIQKVIPAKECRC